MIRENYVNDSRKPIKVCWATPIELEGEAFIFLPFTPTVKGIW